MKEKDGFKDQWNQFKRVVRDNFEEITAEDISQIDGKRDVLISKIQARYGLDADEAEEQLSSIEENTAERGKRDSASPRSGSNPQRRGEKSSISNRNEGPGKRS